MSEPKNIDALFQLIEEYHQFFYPKKYLNLKIRIWELLRVFVVCFLLAILVACTYVCFYKHSYSIITQVLLSRDSLKTFFQISLLFYLYMLAVVLSVYIVIDIYYEYKKPLWFFVRRIKQEIFKELEFINKASKYPIVDLSYLADKFGYGCQERFDFGDSIIGSIRKIGFLPKVLAFTCLAYNIYRILPANLESMFISFICWCCGIYIAVMIDFNSITKTKKYIFLLRQAIALKERLVDLSPSKKEPVNVVLDSKKNIKRNK